MHSELRTVPEVANQVIKSDTDCSYGHPVRSAPAEPRACTYSNKHTDYAQLDPNQTHTLEWGLRCTTVAPEYLPFVQCVPSCRWIQPPALPPSHHQQQILIGIVVQLRYRSPSPQPPGSPGTTSLRIPPENQNLIEHRCGFDFMTLTGPGILV